VPPEEPADPGEAEVQLPPPGVGGPGGEPGEEASGADLARSALGRARAAASARGLRPSNAPLGTRATKDAFGRAYGRPRRGDASARSGAWPDARDPQALGGTLDRLVGERGWEQPVAVGGAFGRWDVVVGPELAGHCTPESLDEGTLTVRAESTAWATQVRLLVSVLVRRLDEELGHGVVTKVVVKGPTRPSWRKGGRSATGGRGPRDTYG